MKSIYRFILPLGLALSLTSQADTEPTLFAALAMTKAQEASSLPTDSGLFIYDRHSDSWDTIGPEILFMNSIAVDPKDPDTIFIACGNGIVRSQDGGKSWRQVTGWRESDVMRIAIDPEDSSHIYAASVWGVNVSRDGGESWENANRGLHETWSRPIVVDQRQTRRVLVGTEAGLYESKDRAREWQRVAHSPWVPVLDLQRSATDLDTWLMATEGQGVFISRDDGRKWTSVVPELAESNIYSVSIDPADPDRMIAGGWDVGVWVSSDGGKSWQGRGEGLASPNVTAVTFDALGSGRIWASTFEEGTFYSDDLGRSWQHDERLDGAYVFDLSFAPLRR
ncbi:MAG: hypothetical protein JJU20_03650 [Opitutales bacterium]|nr:hypothetical protein [Opitutales bacterium]